MATNPTKKKIAAAKSAEEKLLIVAQYNARRELVDLMTGAADAIRRILQGAAGRDGTINERDLERVTGDAGQIIRNLFVDRTDPRGRRVFAEGNRALSPYAEALNRWIAWSTRQVVKHHHNAIRSGSNDKVYQWLKMVKANQLVSQSASQPMLNTADLVSEQSRSDELLQIAQRLRIFSPNPLAEYEQAHTWVDPNGYRLSDRIWRTGEVTRQRLDALIAEGIRQGRSAVEIANLAERFLRPDRRAFRTQKPYGQDGSYDALRLARTEITRANGQAHLVAAKMNPYVWGTVWNLSPSHPKIDICDDNAFMSPYGINDGIPQYPAHPHCVTPGQLVTTLRGDVAIESVQVGDEVLTHEGRFQRVAAHWSQPYQGTVYQIRTSDGELELTPEHPVRTSRDWIHAGDLQPGDQVLYAGGDTSAIQRVMTRDYDGLVYNMEVEGDNSYTVNGAAVHNCLCYLTSRVDDPVRVTEDLMRMMDAARDDLLPYLTPAQIDAFTQQLLGPHLAALGQQAEAIKSAKAGTLDIFLDLRNPVRTVNGLVEADNGNPGNTPQSLMAFIEKSRGPLARAMWEGGYIESDWSTDQPLVNKANVQAAARKLAAETLDIRYGRDYLVSLAKDLAAQNGIRNLTDAEAEVLLNSDYATRARAILEVARIHNITLTEAQWRRLNEVARNNFLDLTYAREGSERGTLSGTGRGQGYGSSGSMDPAQRARAELERQEWLRHWRGE